jgi:hypothetical protein
MAEVIKGTVESVETKTLERKDGKGSFEMTELKVDGKTFKGFTNKLGDLPSEGDTVSITFQPVKNGKFTNNNIVSLDVLPFDGSKVTTKTLKESVTVAEPKKTAPQVLVGTVTTSKDISMEVSGLLQALISTNKYFNIEGDKTFLAEKLLETHLRLVLNLKRRVASELEDKGSV